MADTKNKINYFLEQVQRWLPYIIEDKMKRQEQQQALDNALRVIIAKGEQTTSEEKMKAALEIVKNIYAKEHYLGRPYSEKMLAKDFQRGNPELFALSGYQPEPEVEQLINTAIAAKRRNLYAEKSGQFPNEEDIQQEIASLGGGSAQKGISEIIKVQEAAKNRPLEERRIAVQEKGIPLKEREVGVSEGQLKARWKELAGQIGDMTAKEARDELNKLGVERRKYQERLAKKTGPFGEPLSEDQLRGIKSNIAEIKRLEDKIDSKYGKNIEAKYKAIANDLKGKRYTAADLDTDEQLRSILTEKGYNIDALKKYMR